MDLKQKNLLWLVTMTPVTLVSLLVNWMWLWPTLAVFAHDTISYYSGFLLFHHISIHMVGQQVLLQFAIKFCCHLLVDG